MPHLGSSPVRLLSQSLQFYSTNNDTGFPYWGSPGMVEAYAMKDYLAGTRDNAFVVDGLKAAVRLHPGFGATSCVTLLRLMNGPSNQL